MKRERVLVGLSGGVGSAVAASLLKSQGFEVHGVHFSTARSEGPWPFECAEQSRADWVKTLAKKLGIVVSIEDFRGPFEAYVADPAVHAVVEYKMPSPCNACQLQIKLLPLLKRAKDLGFDKVATGHYAQILLDPARGRPVIYRAVDKQYDQSGFLSGVGAENLDRMILPLGGLSHTVVQRMASQLDFGFPSTAEHNKMCFINHPSKVPFYNERVAVTFKPQGTVVDSDGRNVGRHEGIVNAVIGSSTGFELITNDPEDKRPYHVIAVDQKRQAIVIGREEDSRNTSARMVDVSWVYPQAKMKELRISAMVRPYSEPVSCRVTLFENASAELVFDEPVKWLAPGNMFSFYDGDELLGGGRLESLEVAALNG